MKTISWIIPGISINYPSNNNRYMNLNVNEQQNCVQKSDLFIITCHNLSNKINSF